MITKWNLHRVGAKPQWQQLEESERNQWQMIAASTNGIITPGNAITLVGAAFTFYGLILLTQDVSLGTLLCIAVGRLADVFDGAAAEATGTKSPLGETLDASIDKLLMLTAIVCLLIADFVPVLVLVIIVLQNIVNGTVSLFAKFKKTGIHPTLSGKLSVALSWSLLFLYALPELTNNSTVTISVNLLTPVFILTFLVLALKSSYDYVRFAFNWKTRG